MNDHQHRFTVRRVHNAVFLKSDRFITTDGSPIVRRRIGLNACHVRIIGKEKLHESADHLPAETTSEVIRSGDVLINPVHTPVPFIRPPAPTHVGDAVRLYKAEGPNAM